MNKKNIPATYLIELKRSLSMMVYHGSMGEDEMLDILERAGLTRMSENNSWIDSDGSVYNIL